MHRFALFVLLVTAAACGKGASPTSPSPNTGSSPAVSVPPLTGRFSGTFSPACAMIGPRAIAFGCVHWVGTTSPLRTVTLNLTQAANLLTVTGTVAFGTNQITITSGSVSAAGTLTLGGTLTLADGVVWTIKEFTGTLNGSTLNISFVVEERRWPDTGDTILIGGELSLHPGGSEH
jgi:hypothetical protein